MKSSEFKQHLTNKILPFWNRLKDVKFGGFYGELDINRNTNKKADKGLILHSRILWFYSNVYILLKDEKYKDLATHCYNFICENGFDKEYDGIYWMLSYDGKPTDTTKHSYNQAFAIYALNSYYAATGDKSALDRALSLYNLLETKCRTSDGYIEAFERTYTELVDNDKLSENGVMASRTMNTLLHIFEAYCELYRTTLNPRVRDSIIAIYDIFCNKMYSPAKERLEVFFDDDYNSLIDLHSYGHDIEASWLLNRGLEILDAEDIPQDLLTKIHNVIDTLVEKIYTTAYVHDIHAVNAECENGTDCEKKIWWVQAESVIGFYNGYERTKNRPDYLEASEKIWQYIQAEIVDSHPDGEWFQEKNSPDEDILPMVSPWKCPYHNGRMCIEMIKRLEKEERRTIPVNPNATKEARDLLIYLNEIAGKSIITGQHTQTNPMEEVEYIYRITGKKPLLQGFELLSYSPNINYDDASMECLTEIEENKGTMDTALAWAKETGGIVTLTFHWYSPIGGRDKSFYAKHTDFDATRILIEGTPERAAFYRDMTHIARELKRFCDANIPVLWRPFHEADGTWFWWGAKGHKTGRALYRLMYDYYVNELHLDNLLWVWSSPAKDGYPGDDYVDVITRDIYLEKKEATSYQKEYLELVRNTSAHKVAALGEVGYIPDAKLIARDAVPWAYYMTWSKEFCIGEQYNTTDDQLQMYNAQNAITL